MIRSKRLSVTSRDITHGVLTALFVLSSAQPVFAEGTDGGDDIVVTALNRTHDVNVGAFGAKDVLNVPLTIQSVTNIELVNEGSRTVVEALRSDPSVQESSIGGAYDNIRIRGFPVDWTNTLRADGLSLAPYQDVAFENVERIDLLKGPSGFLYGFNSPGGTVNYVIKRPTRDPLASFAGEARGDNGYYGHADISGTTGKDDTLGYRLNLAAEDIGDFTHAGDLQRYFGALNVDLRLSEDVVLQLNADYQHKKIAAQPLIGLQANNALPPRFNPRTLVGQPWLQYTANSHDLGGKLDVTLNENWFVVAQANYSVNIRDAGFADVYRVAANGDILDSDIVLSKNQPYKTLSSQAFVSGKFATGPLEHELILGASARFYTARESGYFFIDTTHPDLANPAVFSNLFNPIYYPEPASIPELTKSFRRNRQTALFFSDFISLGDHWQVLAGLRYVQYHDQLRRRNQTVANPAYEQNSFVPSVGLMYKPRENMTFYLSYAQGLEQGGFAPLTTANAGETLNPVKSEQYEGGIKVRTGGLDWSASVFQITKALQFTNAANVYVQDGQQRHRGVEMAVAGRVIDSVRIDAGIAYLDTKQLKTIDPTTLGKRTADTPKFSASASADVRLPLGEGFFLNLAGYYVGSRELDAQNTARAPGYVRADLGLRYQVPVKFGKLMLRANVQNLFDKFYWVVGQEYTSVFPGQPRTWRLSATFDF